MINSIIEILWESYIARSCNSTRSTVSYSFDIIEFHCHFKSLLYGFNTNLMYIFVTCFCLKNIKYTYNAHCNDYVYIRYFSVWNLGLRISVNLSGISSTFHYENKLKFYWTRYKNRSIQYLSSMYHHGVWNWNQLRNHRRDRISMLKERCYWSTQ